MKKLVQSKIYLVLKKPGAVRMEAAFNKNGSDWKSNDLKGKKDYKQG